MSASNSNASAAVAESSIPSRILEETLRRAKSWYGLATAYLLAVIAFLVACKQLGASVSGRAPYLLILLLAVPLVLTFLFQAVPDSIDHRRRKRLAVSTGELRPGYFRLAPRQQGDDFTRADKKHEEIFDWLRQASPQALFLTGQSGSGKSSLLDAWVLPKFREAGAEVIKVRAYQKPLQALASRLCEPGVIWKHAPEPILDVRTLLERAIRQIRPRRLLIVFDQFEEFVMFHEGSQQDGLENVLEELTVSPIENLLFLFVLRSDYIGLMESLRIPRLRQDANWKEVPPFTETAARDFLQGSGLKFSDALLRDVLHEAAEIEQSRGLIRPITLNVCGLVLGRFATGLPRGFRPGLMIRGFLQDAVGSPELRELTPKILPELISDNLTKRPQSVRQLASKAHLDGPVVRGWLRTLGQRERGIVRPLDQEQEIWEISHDFLVPLLDSIVARWSVSMLRRARPVFPWLAAGVLGLTLVGIRIPSDPYRTLAESGWESSAPSPGQVHLRFRGTAPFRKSVDALRRLGCTVHLEVDDLTGIEALGVLDNSVELDFTGTELKELSPLRGLKNLSALSIRGTSVSDLSPLRDLKGLTRLELSETNITDLSPLQDLTALNVLGLRETKIADLSPLRALKNLKVLDLSFVSGVTDVEPLRGLSSLTRLELVAIKATDLSAIRSLRRLTELDLRGTAVSDLGILHDLKELATLHIGRTTVKDIAALHDLPQLSELDLEATKVTDISPLRDMESLTSLNISGTGITDLSALRNLPHLTALDLSHTRPRDTKTINQLRGRGVRVVGVKTR